MNRPIFDHERLEVYRVSLDFVAWAEPIMRAINPRPAAVEQLDRASTSIPLNIAEGNGKSSMRDRCRFFEIARGSAVECAACLDVLSAKNRLNAEDTCAGKEKLASVVNMLVRLIQSCANRVAEDPALYHAALREMGSAPPEQEQE